VGTEIPEIRLAGQWTNIINLKEKKSFLSETVNKIINYFDVKTFLLHVLNIVSYRYVK